MVGIVSDARRRSLDTPPRPAVYLPYTAVRAALHGRGGADRSTAPRAVASAVKAAVAQIDPDLPIGDVKTIEQIIDESTGQPRFRSFLIASFAGLALLLAAVGVYGLISFTVTQRVPGDRRAAGARRQPAAGVHAGDRPGPARWPSSASRSACVAAAARRGWCSGLLFNTSATDPVVYASLSLLLLAMAALACYVPARRAMRVDPMTALRTE